MKTNQFDHDKISRSKNKFFSSKPSSLEEKKRKKRRNSSPKNRTKTKENTALLMAWNALFIKIQRQIVTSSEWSRVEQKVRSSGRVLLPGHKREPRLSPLRFVVRCTHVESFIVSFRWTILPEQFPEVERSPLWLRSGRFAPSNRRNCRLWGGVSRTGRTLIRERQEYGGHVIHIPPVYVCM